MSEIAYEARLILERIQERIRYHTYQRDRWDAAWEKANRAVDPHGVGRTTEIGHYEHARMYEHVHALMELVRVASIIEVEIEAAKMRSRFEQRGMEDGKAAGDNAWDTNIHPSAARRILIGIRDGDPEIMDMLPDYRINGEWADDPTWQEIYIELSEIDPQDWPDDGGQDMYEVYTAAFTQAAQDVFESNAKWVS